MPSAEAQTIEVRSLEGDELSVLEPVLASKGWMQLHHPTSRAVAAFEGEKVVGFLVLQLTPHLEPMWIDDDYRGTELAQNLINRMLIFMAAHQIRGFVVVAESPHVEAMCKEKGMVKVEAPVYVSVGKRT